jgi:hypothetical protein
LVSNIRNPPLETIQLSKKIFFTHGSRKVQDEEPACLKNGGFFKTSQLNNGGFAYIQYPLFAGKPILQPKNSFTGGCKIDGTGRSSTLLYLH